MWSCTMDIYNNRNSMYRNFSNNQSCVQNHVDVNLESVIVDPYEEVDVALARCLPNTFFVPWDPAR